MDPFSVTTGAVALMGLCVTVAHAIKSFIERAKTSKAILIKLLDKVEHVRSYLAQLRSISARLSDPEHKNIIIPFDHHACELTMIKLKAWADKIGGAGNAGTIKVTMSWLQNRRVAEELVAELDSHQTNITHAFLALAASVISLLLSVFTESQRHSSVLTKGTVEDLVTEISELKMNQTPFQEPGASTESKPSSSYTPSYSSAVVQIWPAQVTRDDFPPRYLDSRDQLADAAFHGEWDNVFHIIELGRSQHFQLWVNAARLSALSTFYVH